MYDTPYDKRNGGEFSSKFIHLVTIIAMYDNELGWCYFSGFFVPPPLLISSKTMNGSWIGVIWCFLMITLYNCLKIFVWRMESLWTLWICWLSGTLNNRNQYSIAFAIIYYVHTITAISIIDHSSSWFHKLNVCNGGVPLETGKSIGLYSIFMFGFKPLQYILKNKR